MDDEERDLGGGLGEYLRRMSDVEIGSKRLETGLDRLHGTREEYDSTAYKLSDLKNMLKQSCLESLRAKRMVKQFHRQITLMADCLSAVERQFDDHIDRPVRFPDYRLFEMDDNLYFVDLTGSSGEKVFASRSIPRKNLHGLDGYSLFHHKEDRNYRNRSPRPSRKREEMKSLDGRTKYKSSSQQSLNRLASENRNLEERDRSSVRIVDRGNTPAVQWWRSPKTDVDPYYECEWKTSDPRYGSRKDNSQRRRNAPTKRCRSASNGPRYKSSKEMEFGETSDRYKYPFKRQNEKLTFITVSDRLRNETTPVHHGSVESPSRDSVRSEIITTASEAADKPRSRNFIVPGRSYSDAAKSSPSKEVNCFINKVLIWDFPQSRARIYERDFPKMWRKSEDN